MCQSNLLRLACDDILFREHLRTGEKKTAALKMYNLHAESAIKLFWTTDTSKDLSSIENYAIAHVFKKQNPQYT